MTEQAVNDNGQRKEGCSGKHAVRNNAERHTQSSASISINHWLVR